MTNSSKNTYKIAFSSALGKAVQDYCNQCDAAESAARAFVLSLGPDMGFIPCDEHTEYVSPEDATAGGVLAIALNEETAYQRWNDIDHIMWDHVHAQSADGESIYWFFPRVTIEMHYMRLDKAKRLLERRSPEWTFVMDREHPEQIKTYIYDSIRRQCLPEDIKAMTPKSRVAPHPATKCALGTKYKIEEKPDTALRIPLSTSKPFADAVALYKAVKALPTVPANALALVLGLHAKDRDHVRRADIYVEYRCDAKHQCWLVHTGLVSDNPDFRPTQIEW